MIRRLRAELADLILKIFIIICHSILLAVFIGCSWVLDKLLKLAGFGNSIFITWIENYDTPVVILTLCCIFIITMFGDYIPRSNHDQRFEIVMEEDTRGPVIVDGNEQINVAPIADNNENNDMYQ